MFLVMNGPVLNIVYETTSQVLLSLFNISYIIIIYTTMFFVSLFVFLKIFLGLFVILLIGKLKISTGNGGNVEGTTCSKGSQGGIKPGATATRTQPLYMGRPLY